MSDDLIGKTTQLLENKRDQLKPELANKTEERDKVIESFSELLSVPFWENPLKFLSRSFLKRKSEGLKREIPALEEKIEHYEQGIIDLKQGIYSSVMPLLEELAFVACLGSVRSTRCREISELIEEFTALKKGGKKGPL